VLVQRAWDRFFNEAYDDKMNDLPPVVDGNRAMQR